MKEMKDKHGAFQQKIKVIQTTHPYSSKCLIIFIEGIRRG
jgi:hypothetical protein